MIRLTCSVRRHTFIISLLTTLMHLTNNSCCFLCLTSAASLLSQSQERKRDGSALRSLGPCGRFLDRTMCAQAFMIGDATCGRPCIAAASWLWSHAGEAYPPFPPRPEPDNEQCLVGVHKHCCLLCPLQATRSTVVWSLERQRSQRFECCRDRTEITVAFVEADSDSLGLAHSMMC